jgi:Flp pilus assembly protein protease CpaA
LEAALWTAAAGGLIALGVLSMRALKGALGWTTSSTRKQEQGQDSIPYAPAIALGVWLSLAARV